MTNYRERYQQIYKMLTRVELQKGSEGLEGLTASADLFDYDTDLWLGFYSAEGLELALERYGFIADLNRLGFEKHRVEIRTDDPDEHMLRIWSVKPALNIPLVELVVHRDFLRPTGSLAERLKAEFVPVLTVEWLLLQNPLAQFSATRPPLPGQHFPGLGIGHQVLELLRNACLRLKLGGITTIPSYFHNAVFYSEEFRHFDPYCQGIFLSMCRDIIPRTEGSVCEASWALNWKMIRNELKPEVKTFPWFQELMVAPVDPVLQQYFQEQSYRKEVQQALVDHSFTVFEKPLRDTLAAKGISPWDPQLVQTWIHEQG